MFLNSRKKETAKLKRNPHKHRENMKSIQRTDSNPRSSEQTVTQAQEQIRDATVVKIAMQITALSLPVLKMINTLPSQFLHRQTPKTHAWVRTLA